MHVYKSRECCLVVVYLLTFTRPWIRSLALKMKQTKTIHSYVCTVSAVRNLGVTSLYLLVLDCHRTVISSSLFREGAYCSRSLTGLTSELLLGNYLNSCHLGFSPFTIIKHTRELARRRGVPA